jgi:hypothetical protein
MRLALTAFATTTALLATPAQAVSLGQTDSFQSGSTLDWRVGSPHPLPPSVVASGGPGGAGDGYLLLQAEGGSGPASRLAVQNTDQWSGNYLAAGITALTMDVYNFGPANLSLRLLFDGDDGTNQARAWSAVPLVVPAGSGWQRLVFPIQPSDLRAGSGSVNLALSSAYSVRLYHGVNSSFPGGSVVATLGVDNITAVPEPSAAALLALGLAGLGGLAWRRRAA